MKMPISRRARATGYTDFYKNGTKTPSTEDSAEEETDMTPAEHRKAALKRRLLKIKKAGK